MNPAILYDDAAAFADLGEADGYDVADLYTDAAALFHEQNVDGGDAADVDHSGRDIADLYEEAAGLVEAANDTDISEEWREVRRSGDAAFFGKLIKKAKAVVSKAKSAVSSVARTVAKAAAPVVSAVKRVAAPVTGVIGKALKVAAPLLPLAKTVASFVPGAGTAVSAALSAAEAIAKGKSLSAIALDAARGAIPGGPLGQTAFSSAVALAQGSSISEAALAGARSMVPPEARQAFDLGVGAVLREKAAKRAAPPRIRTIAKRLVQSDARGLDLDAASALCSCSPGDAADAMASIAGALQRIARGGEPVLLREPEISQQIRAGKLSYDQATTAFGSYRAPWQTRERRGVPIRAGKVQRVGAAFEPARLSGLTQSDATKLLAIPTIRSMPRGALVRMIAGTDARGLTPDGAIYVVESGDYGLQQIATKLGHPGAEWKELRDANLSPNGAKKSLNPATGAFTFMNAGDKLSLPAGWVKTTAAPPPPAPPADAIPVSITIPGTGLTIPRPPVLPDDRDDAPPTGAVPSIAGYKRTGDGGSLPLGAKVSGGATQVAHTLSDGEFPAELARRYGRPAPATEWRDLRPVNPSKTLNADGTFKVWATGETVNIPDSWITFSTTPALPVKIDPAPPIVVPKLPPAPVIPGLPPVPVVPALPPVKVEPKLEDILPTKPPILPDEPGGGDDYTGGGGEGGGGGSSDYWKGYTPDGAVQVKAILIRYLVEEAKTQTTPPLGTMPVDTMAAWDQRAQEATRIFQRAQGLVPTGTPDDVTYQTLRAWLASRPLSGGGGGTVAPASGGGGILPLLIAAGAAFMFK